VALLASHAAQVRASQSHLGGMHASTEMLASSGVYVRDEAGVLLDECGVEHCELFGVRVYHLGRVLMDRCRVCANSRAVGLEHGAHVEMRACDMHDNKVCVFQAISEAGEASLVLTSCVIRHRGDLWFSGRRPGQVVERHSVASTPSISYATQSITGGTYSRSNDRRMAGLPQGETPAMCHARANKFPKRRAQFHPGFDDMEVRDDDIKWLKASGAA
jgi:hypothetical protein